MAKSKKTSDAFDMADDIRKEVAAESVADACSTSVPAIYWPDNQYVRLVELFIDRNRTREKKYWFSAIEAGFVANGRYDQWVKYVWDGEPKICSPYDAN